MNRSRWLVLAALGLLLIVLSNSHVTLFHGGFRLFGFNPLVTAILLAVVIWILLDRCGAGTTTPPAEHENEEDADKTD